MFIKEIKNSILKVLKELEIEVGDWEINLEHPDNLDHGDYSSNIALMLVSSRAHSTSSGQAPSRDPFPGARERDSSTRPDIKSGLGRNDKLSPKEIANSIMAKWQELGLPDFVEKIEVAGLGFLNIWLNFDALGTELAEVLNEKEKFGNNSSMDNKKIMVEYAHPNTHKELHIGHMRTLITGEALARIFSSCGAQVFRANYQGDIGPHVAKAIWGTEKILEERKITWEEAEKLSLAEKAHLLGEGYVRGSQNYEEFEKEIDELNKKLYNKDPQICLVYERTRRWSLEYYDSFYCRFLTKFDQLFFESEIADEGKKIVETNVPNIFTESEGAVIFDGEPYGLHKRVFITANGTPTYEAKEMALAKRQYAVFPFDLNVHVVGSEQAGYFKVVIKAIELLFPELKGKEYHLAMGMVNFVGRKMSSRTGDIIKVDDLIEEIKALLIPLIQLKDASNEEKERIAEVGTIAAIKYSVLQVGPKVDVTFDIQKSVSLQGNSGPYLQYTYARTCSVLAKAELSLRGGTTKQSQTNLGIASPSTMLGIAMTEEEKILMRTIYKFPEVVEEAAKTFSPNILCNFLFNLAQQFNLFYEKERIIGSKNEEFRLMLTAAVGQILKNGLNLLGIEALQRM